MEQCTPEYRSVVMGTQSNNEAPRLIRSHVPVGKPDCRSYQEVKVLERKYRIPGASKHDQSEAQFAGGGVSKPWKLESSECPAVQEGQLLERTIVTVKETTPQEVVDRISTCLRFRSIHIIQPSDSDSKKNSIRAESNQGLVFGINVYTEKPNSNVVVVECQRLAGCCYEFQQVFQAVYFCSKGYYVEQSSKQLVFPTCLTEGEKYQVEDRVILEGFQACLEMIQSNRMDTQLLGLEGMEKISTHSIVLSELFSDPFLSKLVNLCQAKSEPSSTLDERHGCLSKRRALSILANGLVAWNENGNDATALPEKLTSTPFIQMMLSILCEANSDPHQAYQATRCLVELASTNPRIKAQLVEAKTPSLLRSTNQCPHLDLEQESKKLERILSQ
eukprot:scaffold5088_cov98-Cylindrotheca_fusiformis.AAC.7